MSLTFKPSKEIGKSVAGIMRGRSAIIIPDVPTLVSRYGHGKPSHPQLSDSIKRGRDRYRAILEGFLAYEDLYAAIPRQHSGAKESFEPNWDNDWLPGLDSSCLYGIIASRLPARYIEIGSGISTRFARRAVDDHQLATTITSIDPEPRASIDSICDQVHRVPVQQVDLELFDTLEAGDILFVDSSHRVFTNSDVTVIFMDILPRLKAGVIVHFHDIWLPDDYQPAWSDRYYSEQYMLAMLLMFSDQFEIMLPNHFITHDQELSSVLAPLWERPEMQGVRTDGASFWLEKK